MGKQQVEAALEALARCGVQCDQPTKVAWFVALHRHVRTLGDAFAYLAEHGDRWGVRFERGVGFTEGTLEQAGAALGFAPLEVQRLARALSRQPRAPGMAA